uniref:Secreted protein n=1 Tax=Elaeophora elaphi TaxID=1147741 RepID=A0A0R3RH78_9BILA
MNTHRENMLTVILAILLCVVSQCSIANAVSCEQLCHRYSALSQYQSEPHSAKRTNYDFIRFGRGGKASPATYDYIRFGKRLSEFWANQNSEQANLAR